MHKVTMEDIHKILYLNFFIIVFQSIERYGEKKRESGLSVQILF